MHQRARNARAAFKRPSWWVLVFGWSLAACAGIVNSVSFGSFGRFVSHATGATTSIALGLEGFHHGRHGFDEPAEAIKLLFSFLVGAFLCGLLIDKNQVHFGGKSLYGAALVGNAILLVGAVALFDATTDSLLAACLAACACGLQNAMCTSHFGAVVRTTHVTGTVTDIGSTTGRMAMIFLRKGCRRSRLNVLERAEVGVDARKLLVLGPMWLHFFFGTVIGAYLQSHIGVYGLLVPALVTFSVGLAYTLFRPQLKSKLKRIEKNRLTKDVEQMHDSMARTKNYILDVRNRGEGGASSSTTVIQLEAELGQMMETMQQVEVDLQHLYRDRRLASDVNDDDDPEDEEEDEEYYEDEEAPRSPAASGAPEAPEARKPSEKPKSSCDEDEEEPAPEFDAQSIATGRSARGTAAGGGLIAAADAAAAAGATGDRGDSAASAEAEADAAAEAAEAGTAGVPNSKASTLNGVAEEEGALRI